MNKKESIFSHLYVKQIIVSGVLLSLGLIIKYILKLDSVIIGFELHNVIFIISALIGGYTVMKNGFYSILNKNLDIDLLITIAIIGSLSIGYYVEASSLAFLFGIAEILEDYAVYNANKSISELINLKPQKARIKKDSDIKEINVKNIKIDDNVIIKPGDRIPVDGKIVEGSTTIDESPITGESVPIDKSKGDDVFAGTLNQNGYIEVLVSSENSETILSNIIKNLEKSNRDQTEKEEFITKFTKYYTPAIVIFAILVAIVPPLIFSATWETWIIRGLTLLVVSCPCAFAISTPVAVVSAITSALRNGVLIKSSKHLEKMADIDVIAMDKTGTITTGNLEVDQVITKNKDKQDILKICNSLESKSNHPIAQTISNYCSEYGQYDVSDFENLRGSGVKGTVNGDEIYIGNKDLFDEEIIDYLDEDKTTIIIGTKNEIYGYIIISDQIRKSSKEVIKKLKSYNIKVIMLTGDNEYVSSDIANKVGIDTYHSNLKPDDKLNIIENIKKDKNIAMVGDGINDALALKTADVGISMGSKGSDTAIQSSDIALMNDNLSKIPYLFELSRNSVRIIKQNVYSSILVKLIIALLVPFGVVSVAIAILISDMGMTLVVIGNSMRLSNIK